MFLQFFTFKVVKHIQNSFETLTVVMFQVKVIWVVMTCGIVVWYQCCRGQWGWRQHVPLKCCYPFTTQKTLTWNGQNNLLFFASKHICLYAYTKAALAVL